MSIESIAPSDPFGDGTRREVSSTARSELRARAWYTRALFWTAPCITSGAGLGLARESSCRIGLAARTSKRARGPRSAAFGRARLLIISSASRKSEGYDEQRNRARKRSYKFHGSSGPTEALHAVQAMTLVVGVVAAVRRDLSRRTIHELASVGLRAIGRK